MSKGREQTTSRKRFKPYPAYKDSGVEWLGGIPAHWEVKKLAWLTKCLDGRRVPLNAEERGRMQGEHPYWGANSVVDYVDKWLFDEELVLLGEDGAPFFERNKTVAFRVTGKIWVNNHAHVLRPGRKIDAAFLAHALNCVDYRAFIDGTTRDKLTQGDMDSIPIQCPEMDEQHAITAFVGGETERIDALVAKKERLIELLQKKRDALITQAVTKGLDPTVPMKDSGVEWFGKIPAHWEIAPLKRYILPVPGAIKTGPFGSQLLSSEMEEGDIKVYNQRTVIDRDFNAGDNFISKDKFRQLFSFAVQTGDILVTTRGTIGRCAIVPDSADEGILHPCLMRIQPDPSKVLREFAILLIQDSDLVRTQLALASNATTIDVIYSETMRDVIVPKPPIDEQRTIIATVDRETRRIDKLVAKVHDGIEKLKEYRTTLISTAVTGKIDVRGEAA